VKSKSALLLLAFGVLLFTGCSSDQQEAPQQLTVFAASSLSDAMDALADAFEQSHPGVEVLRHYASSSHLAAQLIEGASADVYASANEIQMGHVLEAGLTSEQPAIFATNRLAVIVPADNPAGIESPTDLANQGISLVLAAPDTPIRTYSDRVIALIGDTDFQAAVYANLVSEEANVRQVVAKIALGEADAGMVYTSDVTPDLTGKVMLVEIPAESNIIAAYPVVRLTAGENDSLAQAFIDFLLSPEGESILAAWGFGLPLGGAE
jgi:molybdate transport system substrate-binding protein